MKNSKIAIVGVHGVGKSKICKKIILKLVSQDFKEEFTEKNSAEYFALMYLKNITFIPEQFREVIKDIPNFTKQTEEITLATYAKQLYLENLYTAQCKNILCDRSVLDTFIYFSYFNGIDNIYNYLELRDKNVFTSILFNNLGLESYNFAKVYSKIYLIEPSDREIENDGFRLIDKKQQLEIHKLFLEYFKDFDNVEIINQEEANKEEFIEKVAKELI